jgi:diacylglycerol O-acyltransferase / wax synthase
MTSLPPPLSAQLPEPMTSVDRAWLEMDGPHNPMVVASIMEFEDVADAAALARDFVERLVSQRRFRQRVVERAGAYAWIEDDALHFGYHVRIVRLPLPGSDARLQAAVAKELARGLDRALPLWRICVFERPGRRVTLLFRAHHAIADGISMMRSLLQLTDGGSCGTSPWSAPADSRTHGPLGRVIDALGTVNAALENLTEVVLDDLTHPAHLSRQLAAARRTVGAIGRVCLLRDDNPRSLRAAPCGQRAVAWTSRLSFPAIRRFAHAQGVTINDVFLAALAGAFGRYLRAVDGALAEDQNLRVSVPVNLRAADDAGPGNGFGLVLVDLPVGLEGAHARLDVVAERMSALKQSPEARAVLASLAAAGHLPPSAERRLVNFIGGKAAAVVSNLPGPRRALSLAGHKLVNIVFWPPQAGDVGIGVSCLSYAGHVTVGVSADTAQVVQPGRIIDAFCAELKAMLGRSPFVRRRPSRRPAPATPAARPSPGVHHVKA